MLFLEYPPCSTCKKARKWLDDHGIAYTARHIKENNPSYEELKLWLERSGLPIKKFFNTSGQQYKALGLKDRLPGMGVDEQLQLLATDVPANAKQAEHYNRADNPRDERFAALAFKPCQIPADDNRQ